MDPWLAIAREVSTFGPLGAKSPSHLRRLTALSELLDQEGVAEIDRADLRRLCMRGKWQGTIFS